MNSRIGAQGPQLVTASDQEGGSVGWKQLQRATRGLDHGSPRTLQRWLAKQGLSFTEVLLSARMRRAAKLLTESDLPVSAISKQVGYTKHSNFTPAFRAWSGLTPARFRHLRAIAE